MKKFYLLFIFVITSGLLTAQFTKTATFVGSSKQIITKTTDQSLRIIYTIEYVNEKGIVDYKHILKKDLLNRWESTRLKRNPKNKTEFIIYSKEHYNNKFELTSLTEYKNGKPTVVHSQDKDENFRSKRVDGKKMDKNDEDPGLRVNMGRDIFQTKTYFEWYDNLKEDKTPPPFPDILEVGELYKNLSPQERKKYERYEIKMRKKQELKMMEEMMEEQMERTNKMMEEMIEKDLEEDLKELEEERLKEEKCKEKKVSIYLGPSLLNGDFGTDKESFFGGQVYASYNLNSNISLGTDISLHSKKEGDSKYTRSLLLARGQYDFFTGDNCDKSVIPEAHIVIGLGSETVKFTFDGDTSKFSASGLTYGVGAGVGIKVSENINIGLSVDYVGIKFKDSDSVNSNIRAGAGIKIGLGNGSSNTK